MLNKPIALSTIIWIVVVLLLLAGNIFFIVEYNSLKSELSKSKIALENQTINNKVLDFTKLFIEKVLKADDEVDFETRLKLENAVRNLNDEEVLSQWQKFIDSKTEIQAQEEVKNLLELLVNKISL